MMLKLACRLCDAEEYFDGAEAVLASQWEDASALGMSDGQRGGETVYEHKAYCPGHALDS